MKILNQGRGNDMSNDLAEFDQMSDEDQPPVPDLQQTEVHDRQEAHAEDECGPEPLDEFEDVGLPTNM
jgi:hypothetical protein